jgi:hypothetical protein
VAAAAAAAAAAERRQRSGLATHLPTHIHSMRDDWLSPSTRLLLFLLVQARGAVHAQHVAHLFCHMMEPRLHRLPQDFALSVLVGKVVGHQEVEDLLD